MAVLAAVGSFNVTTGVATTEVEVTGLTDGDGGGSFTPTCVLFWWSGRTESTDTVGRLTANRGFGCALSSSSRWAVGSRSEDAAGSAVADAGHSAAACIISMADGSIDGAMDLVSMDAGGFTLVIDDAFPTDFRVSFLALGGDVTASQGIFTAVGTAPTTQTVSHGLGSTPACVLFGSGAVGTDPPSVVVDSKFMLGALAATGQGTVFGASNDGSNTMVTAGYAIGSQCLASSSTNPDAAVNQASFNALDGTNFVINWIERAAASRYFFVALGGTGVQALVGSLETLGDETTDIPETVGFRPKGMVFASAGRAENTADTPTAHDQVSIGFAASPSQRSAQAMLDEDAVGTSEVSSSIESDAVYIDVLATSGSFLMDLQSVNDTGFACRMDAVGDGSTSGGKFVWYLAIGNAAAAGTGKPWHYYAQQMGA